MLPKTEQPRESRSQDWTLLLLCSDRCSSLGVERAMMPRKHGRLPPRQISRLSRLSSLIRLYHQLGHQEKASGPRQSVELSLLIPLLPPSSLMS